LIAAERNDIETMKLLLDAGAYVNVKGSNGATPLRYAKYFENDDMIKLITNQLSEEIKVIVDKFFTLVSLGQIKAVKEFIESDNIDVNLQNEYKNCAVLIAARNNDTNMLKMLIEKGAKIDVADSDGRTVTGWLKYHKNNRTKKIDLL
jgi:ankyrin repeat protein